MARRKKDEGNDSGSLTYSQVMMLFESLEKQIRIIAEQYGEIKQGIDDLLNSASKIRWTEPNSKRSRKIFCRCKIG